MSHAAEDAQVPRDSPFSALAELDSAARWGSEFVGPARVAIVCHTDRFFMTHRSMWAAALVASGATVTVVAPDTGVADTVRSLGFEFQTIPSTGESSSPASLLRTLTVLLWRLTVARPNVVLLNSQLLYTLGATYALVNPRAHVVRVVGGVGRALASASEHSMASIVIRRAGRFFAHLPNVYTLFQTGHDRGVFSQHKMTNDQRQLVLPGSGIDVAAWPKWQSSKLTNRTVLFASRLTAEKGILEYLEAARILRDSGWNFAVAGEPDSRVASSISTDELRRRADEAGVDLLGHQTDVAALLGRTALLVFPTRHPEGTPRILMEAAASATPCIATREPGCAAVVVDGVTGVLIPQRPSAELIADAIRQLTATPTRLEAMGVQARHVAEETFDISATIPAFLSWVAVGARRREPR